MKARKGSVTIQSIRGRLRLRLPRHVFGGQQRFLSLYLEDTPENRAIAQHKARQIEQDIAAERFDKSLDRYRSIYADSNAIPLGSLWESFTQHKARDLSVTTINKDYRRVANHIARLPTQDPNDAALIRKHLASNLTPKAAKKVLQYLKACCCWAAEEDLIRRNPFEGMTLKARQTRPQPHPFTTAERQLILATFAERDRHYLPLVRFAFLTGCRPSEAAALQWQHIGLELDTIAFLEALVEGNRKGPKTHKIRIFPINGQLRSLLSEIRPDNPPPLAPVFTSPEGYALDTHNFTNRAWRPILKSLAIPYRKFYNCRHSFITECLAHGIPVAQIAAWVGNSPRIIFDHYAGFTHGSAVPEF